MTDVFEALERARPDVDPIAPADRRRFREELFHDGRRRPASTAQAAMTVPWQTRRTARRFVVGAIVLLAIGVAALVVFRTDDSEPIAETDATAATTTVAVAPTPLPDAPTEVELPIVFDPVLLASPPDGYELHWARYVGNTPDEAVGLARYRSLDGGPELSIFIRPVAGLFSGAPPEGSETWPLGDRTLIASPPGPCAGNTCSVDVQWDDSTALSLSWVNWGGEPLDSTIDRDVLVDLAGGLTSQPARWEAGAIDSADPSWNTPSAATAPLLIPGPDVAVSNAAHLPAPPGSSSLVLAAPSGSFVSIQERDGPNTQVPEPTTELGGTEFRTPASPDEIPLAYALQLTCGTAELVDAPGSEVSRTEVNDLLAAIDIDRGEIFVPSLPGWSLIDEGADGDVFLLTFTVDVGDGPTDITLLQSPGGSIASLMSGGRQFEPVQFADGSAWQETTADGAVNIVAQRADTAYEIRGTGVGPEQLAAVVDMLLPATIDDWVSDYGALVTADGDTSCPQQPSITPTAS